MAAKIISVIFSTSFVSSVLRISTPLIFGSMGALICKQGGVLHIAFEGSMLAAAFFGVVGSAYTNSLVMGMICGIGGGVLIMLLLGYFTMSLKSQGLLTGIALNKLASGGTIFIMYLLCHEKGTTTSLNSLSFSSVNLPFINNIPIIGEILSGQNILTYLSFLSVLFTWVLIFKTPLGLRIRAVGENANAAESVGININRIKFITLILGGIIASFGGLYMSMGYLSWFARDMMAGRGFIAIAAQNLGGSMPLPTFIAAVGFGMANALANTLQTLNIPAEIMLAFPYVATLLGLCAYAGSEKESNFK